MRCSHFSILAVLLITANLAFSQNLTVQVTPQINPTEIPPEGGVFNYSVFVTNHESTPQQSTLWCNITTPEGNERLALQPWSASIPAGQIRYRSFAQTVPAFLPIGNYFITVNIGIYPNIILDSDQFTFYKQKPAEWVSRYNGPENLDDEAHSLAVDSFGNVYVTGYSYGGETYDDYITIKYGSSGNQLWAARYNGLGNGYDRAYSLAIDDNGNVYVTGYSEGIGTDHDYLTIKYDSDGNQLWEARSDGPASLCDEAYSLAIDDSGNVYVTGCSEGIGTGNDYATIKYDAFGNQLWVMRYIGPGNGEDKSNSLVLDCFGNVYVTGFSYGGETWIDYATIKYDTNGNQLWVARYNWIGISGDYATSLAVDSFGSVFVTGYSYSSGTSSDYATIKYDTNGIQIWVARYNGTENNDDRANFIALDGLGNVYVTGMSGNFPNYATIKYNPNGDQIWVAHYNGPGNIYDVSNSLAVDSFFNVYVTGYSNSIGAIGDYVTIKYNAHGNRLWVARYNGPGNSDDEATSLAVDDEGNAYVTGRSCGSRTDYDYATIKYSATDLPNWQQPVATAFGAPLPTEYRLEQNYPNPFNPTTTISYQLPAADHVSLTVYDTQGREIAVLVNGYRDAGTHQVTFDGSNLASGIYFYRLESGGNRVVQKLVLLK